MNIFHTQNIVKNHRFTNPESSTEYNVFKKMVGHRIILFDYFRTHNYYISRVKWRYCGTAKRSRAK